MLVLARRKGQVITIDGDIRITVVKISADVVRIGVDAPPQTAVNREEVFERIRANDRGDEAR